MKSDKQTATANEIPAQGQIKSRKRVAERGEVFTAEREVNAMLDLVKQETERIDSRFLEPACGNGNFLAEILRRKLAVVARQYEHQEAQIHLQSAIAVSSIYGVEIMMDNVVECRQRLLDILCEWYGSAMHGAVAPAELCAVWRYLLERNILWGDALSLCLPLPADATLIQRRDAEPIIFSEWSFIKDMVLRKDYRLASLLQAQSQSVPDLFSDQGDEAYLPPKAAKEYKPIHYMKIPTYYDTQQ
ncbi:MAG: SAM-dependent DNA methyltransferase [Bacteroidaceae bacterium]|nr:SAM-dependent DNA methyltransferase [Bacteroidaceae bacterium]